MSSGTGYAHALIIMVSPSLVQFDLAHWMAAPVAESGQVIEVPFSFSWQTPGVDVESPQTRQSKANPMFSKEVIHWLFLFGICNLSTISQVINHMTCNKFECSHWLKLQDSDWRPNLVKYFFFNEFATNESTHIITGQHVIHNLAYTSNWKPPLPPKGLLLLVLGL